MNTVGLESDRIAVLPFNTAHKALHTSVEQWSSLLFYRSSNNGVLFYFEKPEDATLFLLRWM